ANARARTRAGGSLHMGADGRRAGTRPRALALRTQAAKRLLRLEAIGRRREIARSQLPPPLQLQPRADGALPRGVPAAVRHAPQAAETSGAPVVPDHLPRVVVRAAPAAVLIEVGERKIG